MDYIHERIQAKSSLTRRRAEIMLPVAVGADNKENEALTASRRLA